MTPCNSCDNGKCGSCVAESLQTRGYIRRAADHCGCSERGHKNDEVVPDRPKVKSLLSKSIAEPIPKDPIESEVEQ